MKELGLILPFIDFKGYYDVIKHDVIPYANSCQMRLIPLSVCLSIIIKK